MKARIRSSSIRRQAALMLLLLRHSFGRTWRDIATYHSDSPIPDELTTSNYRQYEAVNFVYSDEQERSTPKPTPANIFAPPSRAPGTTSTRPPSASFTTPTDAPTAPTLSDIPAYEADAETPLRPPRGYFNYDTSTDSVFGPGQPAMENSNGFGVSHADNGWDQVLAPRPGNYYWDEFGPQGFGPWRNTLTDRQMRHNQCGNVGRQSPIDIRPSGVACVEHHQIRTRPGDFRVTGKAVEKQILPSKLRLLYQRRPCSDFLNNQVCAEPDPPHADFPNGWGGFADVIHIDFKFPSEHHIYGEKFDGEMQIYHLHPGRRRLPVISVLIQVAQHGIAGDNDSGYNEHLQEVIDEFQYEANQNKVNCLDGQAQRMLLEKQQSANATAHTRRRLSRIWHPYHEATMPSYYFFGYDGSLTEPPCSEIVSWFVMDTPMTISRYQMEQMKSILFSNVDKNTCQATGVQYQNSVARPIQDSDGRQVWQCTRDNFLPDSERG